MLIATVKHRLHVAKYTIAIEFCKVKFTGDDEVDITHEWNTIRSERYRQAIPKLEAAQKKLDDCEKELNELKIGKPWYRPWYTKDEKKRRKKKDALYAKRQHLFDENEKVKNSARDYTASELYDRLQIFLTENGFEIKNKTQSNNNITTELWSKGDN